jgi:hypothetical protein
MSSRRAVKSVLVLCLSWPLLTFALAQQPRPGAESDLAAFYDLGVVFQDRNGDDVVDFLNARIVLPDSPTHTRATAQGITYNLGRLVSALLPVLVGGLAATFGLGTAFSVTSVAFLMAAASWIWIPGTQGQRLP